MKFTLAIEYKSGYMQLHLVEADSYRNALQQANEAIAKGSFGNQETYRFTAVYFSDIIRVTDIMAAVSRLHRCMGDSLTSTIILEVTAWLTQNAPECNLSVFWSKNYDGDVIKTWRKLNFYYETRGVSF